MMKITINKRKKKNQKKENLKENFSLIPSRPSSTSSDITTSTSIRIRGQPISLPLSNPIQQEPQEEEEAELHIRSTNPTQPIQSRSNGSREEEEEEQSKSEEEQSKSSNSSIYSNEEQTNLNYNHHQISNQTQKPTITLPLSPKKPLRQSQTTLKGQVVQTTLNEEDQTRTSDQAPIPSCSSSTSDSNSHSNQSNSDDHNNEKKNHQQLSESKSDDLEIYIQKVLDRIRTSTTIKHQKQQPLPPPPPSSSSSSSYRTQPKTNHHHHHHHPLESRIKSNQIQFNPNSNELTNLTHKKQQHRFSISSSSSSNKLKKSKSNRSSYIHQSTTLPNESKSQNVPFLATSHPHELNHTNLESNLNHYQLNNHPTAPNHQNQKMNLTTHQFHHQPNSLNLNLNQSSNSHPLQNHLNHTQTFSQSPTNTNTNLSLRSSSPTTSHSFSLTSISKPDDQHLLIPSHPIDQLSPSPSTSTSDHELASLYAKYQSSSHTTATDSMSSSQSSSSSSGNNSNAHLHQSSSIPLPSPLAQTVDSDSLENTIHQSPSINGIHDSNQSEPINAHQSQSINGIHDQAIRLDSESFQSSTSLQTQAKVFDELNLMLGEAIDSAHSDFNHLHITTKSPFAQFDPNQTKQEDLPASTSYSSLLSSVKRKINATKLERQSDRRRSFSPQKLSLQTALSSLDESTADLTIVSSTSSLSQYSEENPYKDDHYPEEEEEEEKVEKSDRLTPLPISKTLSNDESDSSSIHLDQTSSSSTSVTHDSNQPDQQSLSTKVRMTSPTKPQSKIPSSPSSFQPQSPSTPIPINSYPQLISTHGSISRPIDTTPTKSSNPSTTHPTTHHHQTSPINRHINQSSPNLGHIKPRKSLLMSRSSSESSQLNQWQWLESHPSSELRGPPGQRASLVSGSVETGPVRQESMSRSERRLKSLDHHFRSHQSKERSHEIQIKLNLLNKRQEWLDKSIKALSKHQNSKTKSFNHLPAPPTIMTMTKLNYKELKKIKSTVERCKIYASTLNQVNSEPIGLDLWIWYKTHGMDQQQVNQNETHSSKNSNGYPHNLQQTLIRSSHEATRHSSLEDKGTRPSIGKSNYVPHNQSNSIPIPPLSPIPVHLQQFQSTNLPPHSRDVSSGSSSVASFPVRSDAVKAIEITEKKGGPQLMEIVNCTTGNNGLNPLIQVDNLPFPGLYQHGKSQANAIAPDFSTFSFKPTSSQSPAPPPPLTPTRNVTNISHPIPMSKPYSIPTSQPSTQVNRSFLSQLTRRNSHKKVNLQSHHHHHHHHHLNSNPSSSNPALPNRSQVMTNSSNQMNNKLGKISLPMSLTHTSTGSGMVKGPRPLKKKSYLGSSSPEMILRQEEEGKRKEERKVKRNSIEIGKLMKKEEKKLDGNGNGNEDGNGNGNRGLSRLEVEEEEIELKLKRLMNVLPKASKESLMKILLNENGDDIAAIGTYLEEESRRKVN